MANVLPKEKQVAVIAALAEGSSIRSIERMIGINRNTIMNLGVRIWQGCAVLLDEKMRRLSCHLLQFDETWGFIGKKQKQLLVDDDPTKGDIWTFCAIDAETKLVPAFKVGKRDHATAHTFVSDVASRLENRPQISTDGLSVYADAIEDAFGMNVDYGMIIKNYGTDQGEHHQERRYSAPAITFVEKREIAGHPDMDLVCTSHVERLNGITRLHMRRLSRLTHAFSKKLENFEAAVALHFAYYNFVRTHGSLKMTPAMFAGIERDFWTVSDLVKAAS
jgi:IS1 family transposase